MEKLRIKKNKQKLLEISGSNIYIDNDLTLKEREIQTQNRKIAKEKRKKRKNVKIGSKKL